MQEEHFSAAVARHKALVVASGGGMSSSDPLASPRRSESSAGAGVQALVEAPPLGAVPLEDVDAVLPVPKQKGQLELHARSVKRGGAPRTYVLDAKNGDGVKRWRVAIATARTQRLKELALEEELAEVSDPNGRVLALFSLASNSAAGRVALELCATMGADDIKRALRERVIADKADLASPGAWDAATVNASSYILKTDVRVTAVTRETYFLDEIDSILVETTVWMRARRRGAPLTVDVLDASEGAAQMAEATRRKRVADDVRALVGLQGDGADDSSKGGRLSSDAASSASATDSSFGAAVSRPASTSVVARRRWSNISRVVAPEMIFMAEQIQSLDDEAERSAAATSAARLADESRQRAFSVIRGLKELTIGSNNEVTNNESSSSNGNAGSEGGGEGVQCHCRCDGGVEVDLSFASTDLACDVRDRLVAAYDKAAAGKLSSVESTGSASDPQKFALKMVGYDLYLDTSVGSTAAMGDFLYIARCREQGLTAELALCDAPHALKKKADDTVAPSSAPSSTLAEAKADAADAAEEEGGDAHSEEPKLTHSNSATLARSVLSDASPTTLSAWQSWDAFPADDTLVGFRVRVCEVSGLRLDSPEFARLVDDRARDAGRVTLAVQLGLYHGGLPLGSGAEIATQWKPLGGTTVWNDWIKFSTKLSHLPRATRLCATLVLKDESDGASNGRAIGWVNCQLVDEDGCLRAGLVPLRLWPDGPANPIGTCVQNTASMDAPTLYLDFFQHERPIVFPPPDLETIAAELSASGTEEPAPATPAEDELVLLGKAISLDSLTLLIDQQKELLWMHRDWLRLHMPERSLPKLMQSVSWDRREKCKAAHRQLALWPPVAPGVALELLGSRFADEAVRGFAVKCLRALDDSTLEGVLLQLTQVIKYEPYHSSALADFLMKRAVASPLIGHALFWHLKAELHMPNIRQRYTTMLETYLTCCGKYREELMKQNELMTQLTRAAIAIKGVPDKARLALLRRLLAEVQVPEGCRLPLHPKLRVRGLRVEKCKYMDSKKLPLWLVFDNADPLGDPIYIIYKCGDDLRQDALTLQMLRLMDKMWQQHGLDMRLNAYGVVATGDEVGMLEVVMNAETTSDISKAAGGSYQCFMEDPMDKWLRKHNPEPEAYQKAVNNFIRSCAGYCVATCVLGIGDRHNDNIMLRKTGELFHIDFGHFLGNFKSKFGFKRERAKFVFTPDFAYVMGGLKDKRFALFERLCVEAFNILRHNADTFITLFELMLTSGIPELENTDDIDYLRTSFLLDKPDKEAGEQFNKWIHDSLRTRTTQLNNAIHILAH